MKLMSFKEIVKYQWKEYKEMAKNPWFWVFYILAIFITGYFHLWG
jgi:hypothetical protein